MRTFTLIPVLALALLQAVPAATLAEDRPYIPVGTARAKKTVLALAEVRTGGDARLDKIGQLIRETVNHDLAFMDIFQLLGQAAFLEDSKKAGLTPDTFKMSDWSSIGAEILVKAGLSFEGPNLALEGYVYETASGKRILGKRYVASQADAKATAHTFANDIVGSLTGLNGIFLTKIAMSCDRNGKKEIYIMDFDGTNVRQITRHRSIAFAPAWSPDGTRIAYSLYTRHRGNIKNIDLFEFDFASNTHRLLSNRKGINSGAAYSPDGKKIAMTMSFLGNPDIFVLDPVTKTVERVTKSLGFDVDPSWSPDGRRMAFVSSRSGGPMVFGMSSDGSDVQRLTYAGKYNATPSWSPQNNKVAFAGWIDRSFDIFIMNPDGSHIERLTKSQGSNEDPHFSPDGNFIVFSSNRTGQKNIYVMNVDGTFVKRMTYGMGNCVSPKWSNPPR
ncbi:MAG: Tol-Pal system beta propeller repeat protein TolB [Oligoflexia bacterium]|nr:Tol-Pal system beta propeller repeat protein TolB [Oligoflexia bacterium]